MRPPTRAGDAKEHRVKRQRGCMARQAGARSHRARRTLRVGSRASATTAWALTLEPILIRRGRGHPDHLVP